MQYTVWRPLSRDVLLSFQSSDYQLGCIESALWPVEHVKNALQNITTEQMPHLALAHPPEDCLATAAASPLRAAKASPAAKGAVKLLPSARPIPHAFECGKSFVVIHSNLPNSKLVTAFLSGSCCLFLYTPYSRSALCFSSDASAALHARYYQAFLPNQH